MISEIFGVYFVSASTVNVFKKKFIEYIDENEYIITDRGFFDLCFKVFELIPVFNTILGIAIIDDHEKYYKMLLNKFDELKAVEKKDKLDINMEGKDELMKDNNLDVSNLSEKKLFLNTLKENILEEFNERKLQPGNVNEADDLLDNNEDYDFNSNIKVKRKEK